MSSNAFFDKFRASMTEAADTLSMVAQNFVERNRTKAKLNRLRMVMKNESELMNRAYIALGKEYYEALKKGEVTAANEKQKNRLGVIDTSKAKIARARDCYRMVLESQSEFMVAAPAQKREEVKQEDVVDITVACSNEDDYNSSPFNAVAEKAEDIKEAVAEKAADVREAVAEKAEDVKEAVAEKAADVKEAVADEKEHIAKAVKEALDEEYPEDDAF